MNTKSSLIVHPIFDHDSHTITYVVSDPVTKKSAIIDSVLDYHHKNVQTDTILADAVIAYITEQGLDNEWILETHMHADHISASSYLQEKVGGKKRLGTTLPKCRNTYKKYLTSTLTLKQMAPSSIICLQMVKNL